MEICIRCHVSGDEVKLFDAIYEGRINKICERCSIIENVPIIKKPDSGQLKESEKETRVYEKMKKLSRFRDLGTKKTFFKEDKLKELDKNPSLELPETDKLELKPHFHWEIMINRRRRGLSQKQLAEEIDESETAIEMLEKARIPENAEILIKKLEQFFRIKLRKPSFDEVMNLQKKESKPVLLDAEGRELDFIPEPETEKKSRVYCNVEIKKQDRTSLLDNYPVVECRIEKPGNDKKAESEKEILESYEPKLDKEGGLDVRKTNIERVTIGDLRDLQRKRIQATKQEKIEEQKRIEERQRIIEARKEESRIIREKESRKLDEKVGGMELLGIGKHKTEENNNFKKFDDELD